MGPDFSPKMTVKSLTSQQLVRIHQLFRQAKFDDPSGDVSFAHYLPSYGFCVVLYSIGPRIDCYTIYIPFYLYTNLSLYKLSAVP